MFTCSQDSLQAAIEFDTTGIKERSGELCYISAGWYGRVQLEGVEETNISPAVIRSGLWGFSASSVAYFSPLLNFILIL